MATQMKKTLQTFDPWLILFALAATGIGLLFIFDAGYARALEKDPKALPTEFLSQTFFVCVSAGAALVAARIRIQTWKKWSKLVWVLNVVLLLLVMFAGHRLNGAKRWVGIGPLSIQPAEFGKLAAVIYLAGYFAERKAWPNRIKPQKTFALTVDNIWIPKLERCMPVIWVAFSAGLIFVEPDMGTSAVILFTGFMMFFPGGVTRKSIVVALSLAILAGTLAVIFEPYRMQRFVDHPSRWTAKNIDDTEFQTVQSELAISSGGVLGVGLGQGRAKHVLPATTTDFIGATIGEETGLWGSLATLSVLGGLVFRLFYLAQRAPSRFGGLVLYGVGAWLGIQTCVNMMMANAFLPAIGIPLPFVSSGGSSLVALWLAIGVCQSVLAPEPLKEDKPKKQIMPVSKAPYTRGTKQVPVFSTNYRGRLQ